MPRFDTKKAPHLGKIQGGGYLKLGKWLEMNEGLEVIMGRSLFLLLTLIAILFFVLGFFLKPHLLYWVIAFILFLLDFGFYSGRKQRIRYWFQGYRKYLKDNAGDEKKAIAYLLDDFRQSKYAINLNVAEYFYVEALIEEIIIREFNFSNYLLTHGEDKYFKLIAKLRKEIALIKKDCLD